MSDHDICWHEPEPWHVQRLRQCDHRDQPKFSYGRCRSGRRWFWTVLEWLKPETYTSGWEDSEEAALASARDAVPRLAAGRAAAGYLRHDTAYDRLKEINKAAHRAAGAEHSGRQGCGIPLLRVHPLAHVDGRQRTLYRGVPHNPEDEKAHLLPASRNQDLGVPGTQSRIPEHPVYERLRRSHRVRRSA
jgi:hypothetical protein